ncbi:hypothetical protein J4470_05030 [Candidatus Woesearchaeota archaeon]|nr:hypothetical protein [Candidatus Woesearchaeota archaeon]
MDKADVEKYKKCEICSSTDMGKVDFDSPLYCKNCIEEMETRSMSPKRYKKYLELKESLKKQP